MTKRIEVSAQLHTTHVFSGRAPDELTGEQLATRSRIGSVSFRRYAVYRALSGTGVYESPLDVEPVVLDEAEYRLYDILQDGLDYSTDAEPYTWIWVVPESRNPFFSDTGKFYVEIRFHPRNEDDDVLKLTFEVEVK